MSGMHAEVLSGLEIANDQLPGQLDPRDSLATDFLQQESIAAENARTERLLETNADLDLRRGAEKSLAVNHVLVPRRNLDGNDVPRKLGGESRFSRSSNGEVLRKEDRSVAGRGLGDCTEISDHAEMGGCED